MIGVEGPESPWRALAPIRRRTRQYYGIFGSEIDRNDLTGLQIVRLKPAEETVIAELAESSAKARAEADLLEREIATDAEVIVDHFIAHA